MEPISYNSAELISLSVATSSQGNQPKWKTPDGQWYIKECFDYQDIHWRDDKVEVISSQYAKLCHLDLFGVKVLEQEPCFVDGRPAVRSKNFCDEHQYFIPFYRLIGAHLIPRDCSVEDRLNLYSNILLEATGLHYTNYLFVMMVLDCIISNEDRHLSNFGALYSTETQSYSIPPLFDFGLGMLEHDIKYREMPLAKCVNRIDGKPFAGKNKKVLQKLTTVYPDVVKRLLPDSIELDIFDFPSNKAKLLFKRQNQMLGVEVL